MKTYITVLSIAGSDPIGGAGIQADIKTCCALGIYAMTAITAVTAQNTCGVSSFEVISPKLLKAQLDAIKADADVDAVKIGMLPDVASVEIVARFLREAQVKNVVTDPVMVATSGYRLAGKGVKEALMELIFPLSAIVTPNIPEAVSLADVRISEPSDLYEAARKISILTECGAVLLKGGHNPVNDIVNDILYVRDSDSMQTFSHNFVDSENTHGTGCTLSSAIASFLASGSELNDAVGKAIEWVSRAILCGKDYKFGHGQGPLNHIFKQINGSNNQ